MKERIALITTCHEVQINNGSHPAPTSVIIDNDRTPPIGHLVGYYGRAETLRTIRSLYLKARKNKADLAIIEYDVIIDMMHVQRASIKNLAEIKMIDLSRVTKDLDQFLAQTIGGPKELSSQGTNAIIQNDPRYLKHLWHCPDFSHITLFIWIGKNKQRYGAIRKLEDIKEIRINGELVPPDSPWMDTLARNINHPVQ